MVVFSLGQGFSVFILLHLFALIYFKSRVELFFNLRMLRNTGMETQVSRLQSGGRVARSPFTPRPTLWGLCDTWVCIYSPASSPSLYPHLHTLCVALLPPPLTVGSVTWLALANRTWHGMGLQRAHPCLQPLCASAEQSPPPSCRGGHSQPTTRDHDWPGPCR